MRPWLAIVLAGCGRIGFGTIAVDDADPPADHPTPIANLVFVTSAVQPAGSLGGLAGADTLCQSSAESQGYAGNYVAWLSSSTVNAVDRLGAARGWVRPDNLPFADQISDILAGNTWYPPRLDERGIDQVSTTPAVATATGSNGTLLGETCGDYTDPSSTMFVTIGRLANGGTSFGANNVGSCGMPTHLYCFGTDRVVPVSVPPASGRGLFVTTNVFAPGPGAGLAAADALCAAEAINAGLAGSYLALLATSSASAKSRFSAGAPWVRRDGVIVAATLDALDAPISQTASGMRSIDAVWTGAATPGDVGTDATDCTSWTSTTGNGTLGTVESSDAAYFNSGTINCSPGTVHIYCLED